MLLNQDARDLPTKLLKTNFIPTKSEFIFNYDGKFKESINPDKNQLKINKVLVDVECSHDGSLKHVLKYFFHPVSYPKSMKKNKNQQNPDFVISNKEKKRRAKQALESKKIKKSKLIFKNNKKKTTGDLKTSKNE